jgi:hypothetical protein
VFKYLGAWQGKFLFERDRQIYKQFNDYGFQETWREQSITKAEAEKIRSQGRDRYDMALQTTTKNIPPGVRPVWETHPIEYLTWHRDNDPLPYSEMAARALQNMHEAGNG